MAGLLPGLSFGPSRKIVEKLTEGVHELSTKPNESVYIVNCSDATLNVNSRCAKVSVESLKNCTVHVKYSPLTSFVEITNCDGVHLHLAEGVSINTMTVDGSENITIHVVNAQDQITGIWWHKVSKVYVDRGGDLGLFLLDKLEENNKITMFQHVCKPQPDGSFSKEPVMREQNGYPTTEAEKIASDARQREIERAMAGQAEHILKDIKITKKGD